jgi:hypothetical protein
MALAASGPPSMRSPGGPAALKTASTAFLAWDTGTNHGQIGKNSNTITISVASGGGRGTGIEPSPRNSAWWKVIRRTVTAQPPLIASERPKQRLRLISGSSASTFPKLPCDSVGSCCPAVVPSCFYFPVSGLQHELSRYLATLRR